MMSDEQRAVRLREMQDLANEVEAKVPGFEFDRWEDGKPAFGGMMPWQADGHLHGKSCYLRFRHNQASLTVYDRDQENYDDHHREEILSSVIWPYYPEGHPEHHEHTGKPLDEDIAEMVWLLVERLAPVSEDNPSGMMLLGRAVDALVEAEKKGLIKWTVGGRPIDEVYPREDKDPKFVEINPDDHRLI